MLIYTEDYDFAGRGVYDVSQVALQEWIDSND